MKQKTDDRARSAGEKTERIPTAQEQPRRIPRPQPGDAAPTGRTQRLPRVSASRAKKSGMLAFLEVFLNIYVMIKSGILSCFAKIFRSGRGRGRGRAEKSAGRRVYRFPGVKSRLPVFCAVGLLLLCLVVYGTVWLFTNKNAIAVYMNGKEIGMIAFDKSVTQETIKNTAIAKLKASLGDLNVEVNDEITAEPVHAASSGYISMDELLGRLYTGFTYKVEACAIAVNGVEMAVVRSLADATAIQEAIQHTYYQENLNITGASFVEEVINTLKFVDNEAIVTNEKATEILSRTLDTEVVYTVQSGDTLGGIAAANGMTEGEIANLNPGLDPLAFLQIGQELVLSVPKPLLSVRTVERVTYQAEAEKKTENRPNPNEYKTYTKVLQQGKNGQKEVTEDIIRINGIQTETVPVSEKILVEPITEIIEVGTSEVPPKRALGTYIWPTGGRITDYFATRRGSHAGLDIANRRGTPVYASDGGTVTKSDWYSGYGQTVIIDHGNGFETYYAHNSELLVEVGQAVAQGELIAKIGSTGNSSGNHCHFEVRLNDTPQDPLTYLP